MRCLLIAAVFLASLSISSFASAEEAETRSYEMAANAFDSRLYSHAHRWFTIFLTKYPQSKLLPDVYLRLGISSYNLENFDEAEKELKILLDRFPQSDVVTPARYWLGEVELAKNKLESAVFYFESVIKSASRSDYDEDALLSLSYCRILLKEPEKSLETLTELTRRHTRIKKESQYRFQMGITLFDLKRYDEAAIHFDALMAGGEDDKYAVRSLYWLAECYYNLGKYDDALSAFYKMRRQTQDPNVIERILYGLGWTYFRMGNFTDSLASFQELLKFKPDSSFRHSATFKIGENLYRLKRFEDAIEHFTAGLENVEFGVLSRFYLGESYYRLSKFEEALQQLMLVPEDTEPLIRVMTIRDIGLCFYEIGIFDRALEQFTKMRELALDDGQRAESQTYIADVKYASGAYSDALDAYRSVLEDYPGLVHVTKVRYYIGMSLYRLDKNDEAAEVFVNTYTRYKDDEYGAMALYQHAELLRRIGKFEEAIEKYEQFLLTSIEGAKLKRWYMRAPLNIAVSRLNMTGKDIAGLEKAYKEFDALARSSTDREVRIEAYFQVARCLVELNRRSEAFETFKLIIDKFTDSSFAPAAQFEIAYTLYTRREYEDSIIEFEKLLSLFVTSEQADDALMYLTIIAFEKGDAVRARSYAERFIANHSKSHLLPRVEIILAGVLVLEKKHEEALIAYGKLETKFKDDALVDLIVLETGELLLAMDKYSESIEKLKAVLGSQVNEWAARAEFASGKAYQGAGDSLTALEHYLKLIFTYQTDRRRDDAIFEAAQIESDNGKYDDAIKLLELASDKDRANKRIERVRALRDSGK